MEKILEKLKAAGISETDALAIKEAFEQAVKNRVTEETKTISAKADEYCRQKIDSAINLKTAQLESLATKYCEKKAATIARKADKKLMEQKAKLEKLTQQYITEYFDEKFLDRYGDELNMIEEKVINGLDQYLKYAIDEKISADLITKTAMNETFAPIVKGIQHLFEEQYVPLNVSGSKKLKEASRKVATLENQLKEQINENIRLSETAEKAAKMAVIAEKTAGFSSEDKRRVKKFFESKSYSTTKADIDDYCDMISERTVLPAASTRSMLSERRSAALRKRPSIDDGTTEYVTEKFKHVDDADDFLTRSSKYF